MVSARENRSLALQSKFVWRQAQKKDCATLLYWRNDPVSVLYSKSQVPITSEEHKRWFAATLLSENSILMIAEVNEVAIATTRFDRIFAEKSTYRVSIAIAPCHRGKGLGVELLCSAISKFLSLVSADLIADIHQDNLASQKIFASAGFIETKVDNDFKQYLYSSASCEGSEEKERLNGKSRGWDVPRI